MMSSWKLLALALIALPGTLVAQSTAEPVFTPEGVRAHVEFLADDLMEGRDAGTRGYDLAARYVATRFQALGMTPAGDDGWYQSVPLVQIALDPQFRGALTLDGKQYDNAGDVLIFPDGDKPRERVSGDVVFVGYGLVEPRLGIDDYAGLDIRGKVVAMLSGFPKGIPSEIGAHLSTQKLKFASDRGAVGFLGVATYQRRKQTPFAVIRQYLSRPSLLWADSQGRPVSEAPGITIGATLDEPVAKALFAGGKRSLDAVLREADRDGGRPRGFTLPHKVTIERGVTFNRFASPNVLGLIPGSDPALADEVVVISAHLDHDGVNPNAEGEDKIFNGAMDNAAGIATMLEVARAFSEGAARPKRSILFAAVTAEEDGLLGSDYLARHPALKGKRMVANVNLDMPILTYDFVDVIAFGAEHSTLGAIVADATQRVGVTTSPDPMPSQGLFVRSDHYSFVKQGVPSVMLATGFGGEGAKAVEGFLSSHYHQVSDAPNLPINWAAGAKFARVNYLIARAIADAPQAPRWYADSYFGASLAPDQPKAPPVAK